MKIDDNLMQEIREEIFPAMQSEGTDSGFALPNSTIELLGTLVGRYGIRRVFEFGSGRSTKEFLSLGCEVACLEDSKHWMDETIRTIEADKMDRLHPIVQPLRTVWHRGVPMKAWGNEVVPDLRDADLVLIDSPSYPPFREIPLLLSLAHAKNALIVVDDANIPTVRRFCERLAGDVDRVLSCSTTKDHGLYIFARTESSGEIDRWRGLVESLKAWRRYMSAPAPVSA